MNNDFKTASRPLFSYSAYGLGIQSALPIPEFMPADVGSDVTISVENDPNFTLKDHVPLELLAHPDPAFIILNGVEDAMFCVKDTGLFRVQGGRKIVVVPAPDASDQLIRFFLVGKVMSILLYQRGLLVLHASAVEIGGHAVAFLGLSGQGKSSITATLHARGYGIVTDDVAPVILGKGLATIAPGFPQIKISREVAAVLGYDVESLIWLHPDEHRQGYRSPQNFPQAPLPIHCLYILAEGREPSIEPLRFHEAVIELMRQAHHSISRSALGADQFLRCSALARQCTVHRLKRPRDLIRLPEIARLVEAHISCNFHAVT